MLPSDDLEMTLYAPYVSVVVLNVVVKRTADGHEQTEFDTSGLRSRTTRPEVALHAPPKTHLLLPATLHPAGNRWQKLEGRQW